MLYSSDSTGLPATGSNVGPFPRLNPASETSRPHRFPERDTTPLILGQNAPNPHEGETKIPFTLLHPADVRLEIFDLLGRKMAAVVRKGLASGEHHIQLNLSGLNLPYGDYPYHLHATTLHGVHSLSRTMSLNLTLALTE